MKTVIPALVASAIITALEGWAAMLIIGAMHSSDPVVPALSYGASLWLVVVVNLLVGVAAASGVRSTQQK